MDKRDNYFETRIRAARAQINQRSGSFSLPQDLVFRAGAQWLMGCVGGENSYTMPKPTGGRCSNLSRSRDGGVNHHGFLATMGIHP